MVTRGKLAAGIAVAALIAASAYWSTQHGPGRGVVATGENGWDIIKPDGGAAHGEAAASASAGLLTPDQVRTRLFRDGSLAGTEAGGEWCVTDKQLKPCLGLRQRFEYYILGIGEVTIDDLRVLAADDATRAHGPMLAEQIMRIWDKYWQLRTHTYRNQFVQNDRSTWMPLFEEQRMVRRQILGAEWAEAFYTADDKHFREYHAQLESGLPPPPDEGEPVPQMGPGKDPAAVRAERVARYGEAAAARLDKADEEWADWQRRLAAARVEWDRLKAAGHLSDAQRRQDMNTYIKANFKSDEYLRVEALLRL
jgi:lipase chaperone LimK